MNFSEALTLLKHGHRVRRKTWYYGEYLFLTSGKGDNQNFGIASGKPAIAMRKEYFYEEDPTFIVRGDYFEVRDESLREDILADDWEEANNGE